MARLPDLIQTGIRQEDLVEPNGPPLPLHAEVMVRTTNLAVRSMAGALTRALNFGDNFACTVVTAKFTHGVATSLNIGSLPQCKGALVLNADKGHVVVGQGLRGSSTAGQVKLTLRFLDSSATNINVAVVLFAEGIISQNATSAGQAWQNVTFAGAWANYGGGGNNVQYMKDALGFVHLRGMAALGVFPSTIFTLPAGYRPVNILNFAIPCNGAFGYVAIAGAGTVSLQAGSNVWASLEGITFLAEQ
jgi:hypothetical protein